jgi:transglutaminase-like putative cysteine protease
MSSASRDNGSIPRFKITMLVVIVCILALASLLSQSIHVVPVDKDKTKTRSFTIVFTVTYENSGIKGNEWSFTEDDRVIGLFMNSSWQTVYLMNASYPIAKFGTDADGNPIGYMSFPESELEYGENLTYEVAYRVVLKPHSVPEISEEDSKTLAGIPADLKNFYCRPEGPWLVTDPGLVDLQREISGNETNVLTIVKEFVTWIRDNVQYKTSDVPRYPNETLLGKAGDCDDQANLLVTLCRIVGIPAYLQAGCIYIPSRSSETSQYWNDGFIDTLTRIGWHGWAMVYVPPWGWLPVDLTYVSSSNLRANPLNAIYLSAIIAYPTVQYANITCTDYIAATRDERDFVVANGFRVLEHDTMDEELAEEGTTAMIIRFRPRLVFLLAAFSPIFYPARLGRYGTHRILMFSSAHSECL